MYPILFQVLHCIPFDLPLLVRTNVSMLLDSFPVCMDALPSTRSSPEGHCEHGLAHLNIHKQIASAHH